jgi:simple sugar transport system permease protein
MATVTAPPVEPRRWEVAARGAGRWLVALAGAVVIFGALMVTKGVAPLDAYRSMLESLGTDTSLTAILVKGTPLVLAALAVAIPAKAGLVNVGGEGQLLMGGVFAAGAVMAMGGGAPGGVSLTVLLVAGAVGGAAWGALAALLKLAVGINEAVSTLLLNYVALNVMFFLIYDPWKDPNGSGQPATAPLAVAERLPVIGTSEVHGGIVLALVAAAAVWWMLRSTRLGFQLRVVGGNGEAARRAGLRVGLLVLGAMALGGALAGLGGAAHLAGAEFKLRPGFLSSYGYIAFLASWLARHDPPKVVLGSLALAAITIGGDSLQIDSGLPAATVNVLMALVLLAVFGFGYRGADAR